MTVELFQQQLDDSPAGNIIVKLWIERTDPNIASGEGVWSRETFVGIEEMNGIWVTRSLVFHDDVPISALHEESPIPIEERADMTTFWERKK